MSLSAAPPQQLEELEGFSSERVTEMMGEPGVVTDEEQAAIDDFLERLQRHEYLQRAIIAGFTDERREYLKKVGLLDLESTQVSGYVAAAFQQLSEAEQECQLASGGIDFAALQKRPEYGEIKYLLQLSGVATPIIADDWSVNRATLAMLGMNSLTGAELYADDVCPGENQVSFHKGPGNCRLMAEQMHNNSPLHQVGLGFELHFPIAEGLKTQLRQDLPPKKRQVAEAFCELIASLGGRELKARWCEGDSPHIRELEDTVHFKDTNEIQGLMAKPHWVDIDFILKNAKVIASKEFEDDSERALGSELLRFFLRYLGQKDSDVEDFVRIHSPGYKKRRLKTLKRQAQQLRKLEKRLSELHTLLYIYNGTMGLAEGKEGVYRKETHTVQPLEEFRATYEGPKTEDEVIRVIMREKCKILGLNPAMYVKCDVMALQEQISEAQRDVNREIKKLDKAKSTSQLAEAVLAEKAEFERMQEDSSPEEKLLEAILGERNEDPDLSILKEFFTDKFAQSIQEHHFYSYQSDQTYGEQRLALITEDLARPSVDLNRSADFDFPGFIPAGFEQMGEIIPPKTSSLSTALKSNAHLPHEEFQRHMLESMRLMRPGFMDTTDGIFGSFNRVPRIKEVYDLFEIYPQLSTQFEVRAVMDKSTNYVRTIAIHRVGASGEFFRDEDCKGLFGEDYAKRVNLVPLAQIYKNPYWHMISDTRRKVQKIANGKDDIFRSLNDRLEATIDNLFYEAALEKFCEQAGITGEVFVADEPESGKRNKPRKKSKEKQLAEYWEIDSVRALRKVILAGLRGPAEGASSRYEILKEADTDQIQTAFRHQIAPILRAEGKKQGIKIREFDKYRFKPVNDEHFHTFPRAADPITEWNRFCNAPAEALYDNEFYESDEAADILRQDKLELISTLKEIKEHLSGARPILLLIDPNCATNDFLVARLRRILGEDFDELVTIEEVRIVKEDGGDEFFIENHDRILREINKRKKKGGVILQAGSWEDAHTKFGKTYEEGIAAHVLDGLADDQTQKDASLHTSGTICFGYQTTANAIGEQQDKAHRKQVRCEAGMLEMGPVTVKFLNPEDNPFYPGHDRATVLMTHSGNLVVSKRVMQSGGVNDFTVLAESELTGSPAAYGAYLDADGKFRLIGMQWHDEGDPRTDSADVAEVIFVLRKDEFAEALQGVFALESIEQVINNFELARDRILADPGDLLKTKQLLHLARGANGAINRKKRAEHGRRRAIREKRG